MHLDNLRPRNSIGRFETEPEGRQASKSRIAQAGTLKAKGVVPALRRSLRAGVIHKDPISAGRLARPGQARQKTHEARERGQ